MREEGDVTIIPVLEEIVVVEKRLVLKEELHVRRVTERRKSRACHCAGQRAEIERVPAAGSSPAEPIAALKQDNKETKHDYENRYRNVQLAGRSRSRRQALSSELGLDPRHGADQPQSEREPELQRGPIR